MRECWILWIPSKTGVQVGSISQRGVLAPTCCWLQLWEESKIFAGANHGSKVTPALQRQSMIHIFRYKLSQTRSLTLTKCKPSLEAYKELSSQEMELTRMHKELEQNRSLLQLLLQNCPDSVHHLLNRFKIICLPRSTKNISCELFSCIVAEENNNVHFDFFLFHQQSDDHCELAIIDLVGWSEI